MPGRKYSIRTTVTSKLLAILNAIPFAPTTPTLIALFGGVKRSRRSVVWRALKVLEKEGRIVRIQSAEGATRWASRKWPVVFFDRDEHRDMNDHVSKCNTRNTPSPTRLRKGIVWKRAKDSWETLQDYDSIL